MLLKGDFIAEEGADIEALDSSRAYLYCLHKFCGLQMPDEITCMAACKERADAIMTDDMRAAAATGSSGSSMDDNNSDDDCS